ncbi:MAG TPA: hypothetical protein VLJ21_00900 [Candidatus Binatia bacterium]|nr:hypothetical protein [Candidatus Binatia bacterium]
MHVEVEEQGLVGIFESGVVTGIAAKLQSSGLCLEEEIPNHYRITAQTYPNLLDMYLTVMPLPEPDTAEFGFHVIGPRKPVQQALERLKEHFPMAEFKEYITKQLQRQSVSPAQAARMLAVLEDTDRLHKEGLRMMIYQYVHER